MYAPEASGLLGNRRTSLRNHQKVHKRQTVEEGFRRKVRFTAGIKMNYRKLTTRAYYKVITLR
jgi:hypothetical protein